MFEQMLYDDARRMQVDSGMKRVPMCTARDSASASHISMVTTIGSTMCDLSNMNSRLATYGSWPLNSTINPADLARAGLYYSGEGDIVMCHRCGGKIKNWEAGDQPMEEHKNFFPSCPFVIEHYSTSDTVTERLPSSRFSLQHDNVPARNNNSITPGIEYTFCHEPNRLRSFSNFPVDCPVRPEELVKAGLYYTGNDDKVKCAFCKGELYNWCRGDTAMGEHTRHFPRCSFIQDTYNAAASANAANGLVAGATRNAPVKPASIKALVEMGFNETIVEDTFKKFTSSGTEPTAEQLAEAVMNLQLSDSADQHMGLASNDLSQDCDESGATEDVVEDPALRMLKTENERLKTATRCRICKTSDVDTLILPCRHLVYCHNCVRDKSDCPVCNASIIGTVKIYLS